MQLLDVMIYFLSLHKCFLQETVFHAAEFNKYMCCLNVSQAWVYIYLQRRKRMKISGRELAYSVRILYNAFPSSPSF